MALPIQSPFIILRKGWSQGKEKNDTLTLKVLTVFIYSRIMFNFEILKYISPKFIRNH